MLNLNVNPVILFLAGLVLGYIVKLFLPENLSHKDLEKNSGIFDSYFNDLKKRSVKELTAREYQHLSLLKKIEFEKKYPQKADSKIAIPVSKVFTIHSVFPNIYSKSNTKLHKIFAIFIIFSILFFGCVFLINLRNSL
ncbi:MAG: hypothetical protein AB1498_01695 [bacterium]